MSNEFDAAVEAALQSDSGQAARAGVSSPAQTPNEFDAAVGAALEPNPGLAARIGFSVATGVDPDAYAEARRVARRTGVPVDTVFAMPQEMKRQDAIGSIDFDTVAKTAPVTASLLADIEKAKIAHDDVDNLSRIEETLRPITRSVRSFLAGATFDLSSGFYGLLETGFKLIAPIGDPLAGTILPENPLRRVAAGFEDWRKGQAAMAEKVAGDQSDAGFFEKSVNSGFRSFGQMLPGTAATVMTGNPAFALVSAGALQGSQSATKALDVGKTPLQALSYGAQDATAEIVTELLPVGRLLKDLKVGAPFFKLLGHQIATEVPTEMAATAWQNFNEWANLNTDKPFSAYLEALPAAEAQTIIATITTSLLTAGLGKSVHSVVNRMQQKQNDAGRANQAAELLASLNQLAAASKVLQRDPETFEQFVAQAAENGPVQQVFIDARTLMQSGVAEQVAAVSPAVAEQLPMALQTGGQIAIPVEEYAARIAPTEYAQGLLDHLKTDPEGFSRAEAQEYMQNHAEELRAEVERTLAEKQADDTFKQSAEAVRAGIKKQLDAAARFTPQVNDAYAALVSNFYAVTAAKLGATPEELFQRYPLRVQAESVTPNQPVAVYDQGEVQPTAKVDERTGLPLNDDGTVTLYHHTTATNAEVIKRTGVLRSAGEPDVYLTTHPTPDIGYGDAVVRVRIDPSKLELDDEFPGGRKDFRVSVGRPGGALRDATFFQEGKEFRAVERAYGGREAYERAKAAGRTKLNYRQWVQVRTPSFKRWFGDWEALHAQQRLDTMEPIQVRVPEEWRELSVDELRQQVAEVLDEMVRSKTVIEHPELGDIRVGRTRQKKTISEGRDPAKLLVAADLDRVIPVAVYAGAAPDVRGAQNIAGYAKLLAPVKVGQTDLVAVLTVRKQTDGHWYYNTVTLADSQKQTPAGAGVATAGPVRGSTVDTEGHPLLTAVDSFVRQPLRRVNPDTVSKVVDPDTGEPLVVYHGTPSRPFRIFDISRAGNTHKSSLFFGLKDRGFFGRGFYFTPDREEAETYRRGKKGHVVEAFLSIKNPIDLSSPELPDGFRAALDLVRQQNGVGPIPDERYASLVERWKNADGNTLNPQYGRGGILRELQSAFVRAGVDGAFGDGEIVAFHPEQIKSAVGNRGTFDPNSPDILLQKGREKRDDYTLDLFGVPDFGVPDNTRADNRVGGSATGRPERLLSRDDAPGTYAVRTKLVAEKTRTLGADRVTTPEEAAQALAYLADGAVERFDALVTDKDGKPLAIVGSFKGALTEAPVYISTLVAEAFRIKGAANIWFAHNHPSGRDELSSADLRLHRALVSAFRGSGIEPRGLFAIAAKTKDSGRAWVFEPSPSAPVVRGATSTPAATASAPVVERIYDQEERLGPQVTSPVVAKDVVQELSGGQAGVILMTAHNEPVAFVPINPGEAGELRRDGRMDTLYRALSVANAGAAIIVNHRGQLSLHAIQNLAGFFNATGARVLDVIEVGSGGVSSWSERGLLFNSNDFQQQARGAFNPQTLTVTLLRSADLSTFLHEAGHFFLEVHFDLASRLRKEADMFGMDTLKPGERQLLADTDALLRWFGVRDLAEWYSLDFEEKRSYHEQFARGFEAYLFEGKAPSIELQGLFQRFRAWLLNVYRSLKALNVELTDEVRGVFDRMLATNEQIALAEQGRSLMPLFATPEQAGMTPEEFAAYQALGVDATNEAIQDLQARGLRDMRWLHNARGRIIKQLQKEAKAKRAEVRMEVRREVMSQPIYRAWQFLTGKLTTDDKIAPPGKRTSSPDRVDETQDSLFTAIAKLGGLNRAAVQAEWGLNPKERIPMPVFGKHVLRREGGLSIDAMAEALVQYGYLDLDEHGKWDLHDFEEKFFEELRGNPQYSNAYDYSGGREAQDSGGVVNPQALNAGRLDLGELKAMGLPVEVIETLKARRMTAANGLHPDIVAEMFGFTSGDELVRKLIEADPPKGVIEALTDARMIEQHGELSSPEAIERAADRAIHNEVRARFVATEANALAKATGQRKVLASAAKEFARAMIARLKVRNIKPGQYASAEVRAAKAAEKANKSGDLATAAAEKRNQLIQLYATRAAYDALDEVERGLRYLKKFEGDIKGLDADYADQIHALLERFDLRKRQSNKAIDKRAALAEWIKAQREAGLEPDIPPELENEAFRTSYKNLTVEEFRGLVDTVRQIEHLGRLKHKLLTAADRRAYEAVRDEIASSIRENAQGRQADTRTPATNMGRALRELKRFWASHIKAATWARIMDGGKDGGPMWEYFIRTANERADMETTMRAEATAKLSEILAPVFKLGRMGGKGQFFPTINRSLNREARLAIALNVGNEGNLQRLLDGEGWTMAQLTPVLQSLTAQEWQAVQAVWDYFEGYRPLIAKKERRIYGREPKWVEPRAFTVTTADGQTLTLRGGYYPIKYDPAASQRAEEHADAESARRQLQGAYTTATTRRSFTKARAEEVKGRPLLYTLAGLYSGVNDVIHDLAWHEWLIDVNRLLRSRTIDAAIREHYGPEVKQQLKTWVQDIAEGEKGAANAGEAALGWLRQGVSAAGLGFNVMSAAIQITGFTQSIVRIGARWVGRGVAKYLSDPIGLTRRVNELSDFMAARTRTRFRELNELRNQVQDRSKFKEIIGRYSYFLMMRVQQIVDVPTWWGAYEKALAEDHDEARAVAMADQAVIDAQGSGQVKDLSAIERGGPALRLFTVFYTFMNTALNLGVAQTMTANTPAKRAKLAVDYLMLYTVPPVLGFAIRAALTPGDSGDDDLEEIVKKLAAEQLSYLMGLMVVVREFNEAARIVTGEPAFGYQGPAGLRAIADTVKVMQQTAQGEFDDAFRKAAINLIGDFTGLPATQINRTITGTQALAEGKTENPAAVAFGFEEKR